MELAQAFVRLRVDSSQIAKDTDKGLAQAAGSSGGGFSKVAAGVAAAAVGLALTVGVATVKMAANFQEGLTSLVTGAGETEKNLGMVGSGIKGIAVGTGESTKELIAGMYMVESAGFHGANGLLVLKAAAQGAKVGNADLMTVANATTTVMVDYGMKATSAAQATSALVATTSAGKVHMDDLSGSLARVLPTAAALGIGMGQIGGAMATMTGQGTSAKLAAMGLNSMILAMAAPNAVATKAIKGLGGTAQDVADTLTHKGLVAALQMVTDLALQAGPKGSAAYVAALKAMTGGAQGLRVALQLTGDHMSTLVANTASVSKAFTMAGTNVQGWDLAQKDFNVRLSQFREFIEVVGITIGQKLLPVAGALLGWVIQISGFLVGVLGPAFTFLVGVIRSNSTLFLALGAAIGVTMLAMKAAQLATVVYGAVTGGVVAVVNGLKFAVFALNYAFAVNPIGVIIIALVALAAAFYVAWTRSATFRQVLIDAWHYVLVAAQTAWAAMKSVFDALMAGWRAVQALFQTIMTWISGTFDKWWTTNGDALKSIWKGAWTAISATWHVIWDALSAYFKVEIAIWTAVFKAFLLVFTTIWKAAWALISAEFKAAWIVLTTMFNLYWNAITALWKIGLLLWQTTAKIAWAAITAIFKVAWAIISGAFTIFIDLLTGRWGAAWRAAQTLVQQVWNAIRGFFTTTWNAIVNAAAGSINILIGYFRALAGRIVGAVGNLARLLFGTGQQVVTGLFNGVIQMMSGIGNWVNAHIVQPIIGAVKSFFGIASPAAAMVPVGFQIINGLLKGILASNPTKLIGKVFGGLPQALGSLVTKGILSISNLPGAALSALGKLGNAVGGFFSKLFGGGSGSGVERWRSMVDTALTMLGLSKSLDNQVLYQMNTESGGDPNAINNTDINAQNGDPSRGLLQTIGATFMAYHVPGTSMDIYDPLANTAAAINYARARYGPNLMSGGMGMGSGHGYAQGTRYAAPGWAWVGEGGVPELVHFSGGERVGPMAGGGETPALLRELISVTAAVPAGVGRHVGGALGGSAADASFRTRYPAGGY